MIMKTIWFPRFEDAQVLYGQVGVESKARQKICIIITIQRMIR